MDNMLGQCNLYAKPVVVTNCHPHQQQCPFDSYSMNNDEDEVFDSKQEDVSDSEMKSDQWSLYSEWISDEETGSDYNDYNSYNSLDDDQPTTLHTCRQCCTVGQDELVIPKHHNWSLSSDSNQTIVCRYCREEVKNCYYNDHLVRCPECFVDCKFGCRKTLISCKKIGKHYQECEMARDVISETQQNGNQFIINCVPIEETVHRLT